VSPTVSSRRPAYQESRARILAAAQKLFGERGFHGTTTKDLAEAAGVAEKTLFRHFPSKGAIFKDAVITPFHAFVSD
jgi:AcrR family transcriptional regulator